MNVKSSLWASMYLGKDAETLIDFVAYSCCAIKRIIFYSLTLKHWFCSLPLQCDQAHHLLLPDAETLVLLLTPAGQSSASSSTPWWSHTWQRVERRRWTSSALHRPCRLVAVLAVTTLPMKMGRLPPSEVMTLTFWKRSSAEPLIQLR